jgi:hypothetical protein
VFRDLESFKFAFGVVDERHCAHAARDEVPPARRVASHHAHTFRARLNRASSDDDARDARIAHRCLV